MATSTQTTESNGTVVESYGFGVRIVERRSDPDTVEYAFVAPEHADVSFETLPDAYLYADVYFDVNGFVEADTGTRGVPPEIVQAGTDTLAAYLVTMPWADVTWVASFYGTTPTVIERYLSWVRTRAKEVRTAATDEAVGPAGADESA
ncbi:hypothetical protein [Halovivax cerinus]|uniref:Uncharacterized protein n=1 Tax=Halovivax cerinus TaxID=1487865 RepID=A0ABD5NJU4_9EURY|nr:hypothetical protein [Halovivax cerinus]